MLNKLNNNYFLRGVVSVYDDTESLNTQELISKVVSKVNETIEETNKKVDVNGDFKGSWHGIKRPSQASETISAVVDLHALNFQSLSVYNKEDDFQTFLNNLENNKSVIINTEITGSNYLLRNKENLNIVFNANCIHENNSTFIPTQDNPISNDGFLIISNCNNIVIDGLNIISKYEGIIIKDCNNITIRNISIQGGSKSKGNSISISGSKKIVCNNINVKNHGVMPTYDTLNKRNNYSVGHGIGVYLSDNVTVENSYFYRVCQNGLYTYASRNITFNNNHIEECGMSGVQIAFGVGDENNFYVINNTITNNYSDGIDIFNAMSKRWDISCVIQNNNLTGNGFFNCDKAKITQDGSGIATLINLSGVNISNNKSVNSSRTGIHIDNCENISCSNNTIKRENYGDGGVLYIGRSKNILIDNMYMYYTLEVNEHAIALDTNYGDLSNIIISNSYLYTKTSAFFYDKGSNNFTNITFNGCTFQTERGLTRISKKVDVINCKFKSSTSYNVVFDTGVTVVNTSFESVNNHCFDLNNNVSLLNCSIKGKSMGCRIENVNNVILDNCKIEGNSGLVINGTNNSVISKCCCYSNSSPAIHILKGNVQLISNYAKSNSGNGIRCENGSTVYLMLNNSVSPDDFTTATIKQLNFN